MNMPSSVLAILATFLVSTASAKPAARVPPGGSMAAAVRLRVPAVEFNSVALADAFDFMRDVAGLNLHVNWPALEAAGIDRSAPVSVKLKRITLAKLLDLTLGQVATRSDAPRLAWYVSDNIIHITTRDLADRDLVTRVYPVQDLLVDVPNFKGPSIRLGDDAGGNGNAFGDDGGNDDDGDEPDTTMQQRGEKLAALVVMLVMPEVWVENGGYSSIRYFNGNLIVTAPRGVQAMIGK